MTLNIGLSITGSVSVNDSSPVAGSPMAKPPLNTKPCLLLSRITKIHTNLSLYFGTSVSSVNMGVESKVCMETELIVL